MNPVVVEAEVDINRPPEEVFDYCSDHRHEPEWNPMMTRIEKLTDPSEMIRVVGELAGYSSGEDAVL